MAKCTGTRTDFVKKVGKKLEKWLDSVGNPDNPIPALKAIYKQIQEKENQDPIKSFAGEMTRSELFKEAMETYYGVDSDVFWATFKSGNQKPMKTGLESINVNEYLDNAEIFSDEVHKVVDFDDIGTDVAEDYTRTSSKEMQLGDTNLDIFDANVFSALNMRLPKTGINSIQSILKKAGSLSRDGFKDWLEKKYPYNKESKEGFNPKSKFAQRDINRVWLVNQAINRSKLVGKGADRITFAIANIDPMMLDKIDSVEDLSKAILKKFDKRLQLRPAINLLTQSAESEYGTSSFIDKSSVKVGNLSIGKATWMLPTKSMVEVYKAPNAESGWFGKDISTQYDLDTLEKLQTELFNFAIQGKYQPVQIVGAVAGNSGKLWMTPIQLQFIGQVLPANVKEATKDFNISPLTKRWLDSYDWKIHTAMRKLVTTNVYNRERVVYNAVYPELMAMSAAISKKPFQDFFESELKKGNITEEIKDNFIKQGENPLVSLDKDKPIYPHLYRAGIIARHKWWQGARGDRYALVDNVQNAFDRVRLAFTIGVVPVGVGNQNTVVWDPAKVDIFIDGVQRDSYEEIAGMTGQNRRDGATYASTAHLNAIEMATGVNPVRDSESELGVYKPAVSYVDPNDTKSYIDRKEAIFVAPAGMEVKTKDGRTVFKIVDEGTQNKPDIRIYAGEAVNVEGIRTGDLLDTVSDIDASKTRTGRFAIDGTDNKKPGPGFKAFVLPEEAIRIIKLPGNKAHESATAPEQWLSTLDISGLQGPVKQDFDEFKDYFYGLIQGETDKSIDMYHALKDDPDLLRRYAANLYANKDDTKESIRDMLGALKGKGIQHIHYSSLIGKMLFNMLIAKGSNQGRSFYDRSNPMAAIPKIKGSTGILKPDEKGLLRNEDSVIIGDGNRELFNHVANLYIQKESKGLDKASRKEAIDFWRDLSRGDKVSTINQWLDNNPVELISYRFPIDKFGSLVLARVQAFTTAEGNVLYFHPNVIKGRKTGDHDIDTSSLWIIPQKDAETIGQFMNREHVKARANTTIDVGIFEGLDFPDMSSDPLNWIGETFKGLNKQGEATNLRTVAAKLGQIFPGKIRFNDGAVVSVRSFSSRSTLTYAPLRKDMSADQLQKMVDKQAGFYNPKVIVDDNGNKFLQTTLEHELGLILNAAVDHPKKMLLSAWGIDKDFFLSRVFKVEEYGDSAKGKLGAPVKTILRKIFQRHNNSSLRRGEDPETQLRVGADKYYELLTEVHSYVNKTPSQKEDYFLNNPDFAIKLKKPINSLKSLKIEDIEVSDHISVQDKMLVRPIDKLREDFGEMAMPWTIDPNHWGSAHHEAMYSDAVGPKLMNNYQGIVNELGGGLTAANNWFKNFAGNFYDMFYRRKEDGIYTDAPFVTANRVEFDEKLFNFVKLHEKKLVELENKYRPKIRDYVTMKFLMGFGTKNNILHFPPMNVMSKDVMEQYMDKWEKVWNMREGKEKYLDTLDNVSTKNAKAAYLANREEC